MIGFLSEYRASQSVVTQTWDLIFYSESGSYFQYLRHLFDAFAGRPGLRVAYISSEKSDPVLQERRDGLQTFYLRSTLLFVWPRLQAKALIMTMPGLGTHGYRKSPGVGKYVYLFHALVSSHQQYPEGSFDQFDTLFCCGPYHAAEARRTEEMKGLPPRDLVPYGYPLLEALRADTPTAGAPGTILLAPSWHPAGVLNTCLGPVLDGLLGLGRPVHIRPHPEFRKRNPKALKELERRVAGDRRLHLDTNREVYASLRAADLLLTDRSGIAFEYAFARKRPVLFIDTPKKVYNPNYEALGIEPIEDALRDRLGTRVAPGALETLPAAAEALLQDAQSKAASLARLEQETLYAASEAANGIRYVEVLLT